jgi:glutathione S-transferase
VLDTALERSGTGWLVGGKMTYADLSFVTWAGIGEGVLRELGRYKAEGGMEEEKWPQYAKWIKNMKEREEVKKIVDKIAEGRKAHGLN